MECKSRREAAENSKNGEEFTIYAIKRVVDGDKVRESLRDFIDSLLVDENLKGLAFSMLDLEKRYVISYPNICLEMAEVCILSLNF